MYQVISIIFCAETEQNIIIAVAGDGDEAGAEPCRMHGQY